MVCGIQTFMFLICWDCEFDEVEDADEFELALLKKDHPLSIPPDEPDPDEVPDDPERSQLVEILCGRRGVEKPYKNQPVSRLGDVEIVGVKHPVLVGAPQALRAFS